MVAARRWSTMVAETTPSRSEPTMSELTREIIPIVVMYIFVLALAPFIGYAMWMAFDGDRLVEEDAEVPQATAEPVELETTNITPEAREALGAA
jgi:hypothetical protein